MTETVAAACSGVIRQPSMSISTSRNSAAVSAAEIRPSATLGPMRGRPMGIASAGVGAGPRSTGIASRAAGVCARKIACQEIASVSSAAERPGRPRRRAHRRWPTRRRPWPPTRWSAAGARGAAQTTAAPPIACTQRAATSTSNDGASAHTSEAAAKTSRPAAHTSRGRRRPMSAAGTATSASTRLNDVMTHATYAISTSNSRRISGRARMTIDESASTMPVATASPSVSRSLRRSVCSAIVLTSRQRSGDGPHRDAGMPRTPAWRTHAIARRERERVSRAGRRRSSRRRGRRARRSSPRRRSRRVDELAAADVDADVVDVGVEEDEVAGDQLGLRDARARCSTARP